MRVALPLLILTLGVFAQEAPYNGPRKVDPGWHALIGATVHIRPGESVQATVVIRNNIVAAVTTDAPPAGARVWDCKGLHVYAGFIDAHVAVDAEPSKDTHWNSKVTPNRIARAIDAPTASSLRSLGFTAAVAAPKSGIFRGRASLVSLAPVDADRAVKRPTVYVENVYQAIGFERFGRGNEGYPTSLMGAIAVLRQSFFDGLAAGQTLCFDTADELEALRAAKIAREFKKQAIVLGSGLEFRRLDAIAKDGLAIILPLRFPPAPKVETIAARDAVDLRDLMVWEQAPGNAHRLDKAGVKVALTTSRLEKRDQFHRNLRRAGKLLGHDRALAMLTTTPASLIARMNRRMGTVESGKLANLTILDKPLLSRGMKVRSVWIDGKRHEVTPPPDADIGGTWKTGDGQTMTVDAKKGMKLGDVKARHVVLRRNRIHFVFPLKDGAVTFSGTVEGDKMWGHAVRYDGLRFEWSALRTEALKKKKEKPKHDPEIVVPERNSYPFGPYALAELPKQGHVVIRNATIWTSGPKGILKDAVIEFKDGRITYVGPVRTAESREGTVVIDAKGKHVTPGIIDCHSHTGISKGVNDSGQAVTAEVRIGDVTNPDSISWYRQLAGGVTTVNNLHGSANPIGGQNQVNKIRWGAVHPDDMHFEGAPAGIKFALGENVKQSNWGDDFTKRYPQTRMGVETLMRDRFLAAREYLKGHTRVDLELEALGEILEDKRLIHCHSYRQDEILMLCRIAKEFGFRIGTFQHILEGYKVAEAIKEHAIGASAFSDWWAYKVEVQDAIPYNGAIMHAVGVNVSFNSDSDDLARRLNIEAAKAVKYGGVDRAEALKFVTLNPAIQLGIQRWVGSLEEGKHADIALWSGDPLSPFSICESTWVDGRNYFSLKQDKQHREQIAKERRRIIAKILKQPKRKEKEKGARGRAQERWWKQRFLAAACGECGGAR